MSNVLINARCRLLIKQPWYGTIVSRFNWIKSDSISTIGVSIMNRGKVRCIYNHEFIESLSIDEAMAVLCHEVEHIIRMHMARRKYIKDENNNKLWNIACDWVINGHSDNKNIKNLPDNACYIPDRNDKIWEGCDFNELSMCNITEEYYDWLKKNTAIEEKNGLSIIYACGDTDEGINEGINDGTNKLDDAKIIVISTIDDHDIWKESSASEDEMRRTAKNLSDAATRLAGSTPGGLVDSINRLNEPSKNWTFIWKDILGRAAGNKRKTYSRRNRKRDSFGIKGTSRRASIPLVLGVDVSGSMTQKILQKVFSEVESMSKAFKITLIQFDCAVTSVSKYHKGDWKNIKIVGRGGTRFEPFFDYIEENNIVGKMNCVLTDGYANIPEKKDYPVTWIVVGPGSELFKNVWGRLVEITHDYD